MLEKLSSDVYWDHVDFVKNEVYPLASVPELVETTVLPIESSIVPASFRDHTPKQYEAWGERIEDISRGVAEIGNRMNHSDAVISDALRLMDVFRDQMVDLTAKVSDHTSKVGHITAEMDIIRDEAEVSPYPPVYDNVSAAGRSAQRAVRLAEKTRQMVQHREDVAARERGVDGSDTGDENSVHQS